MQHHLCSAILHCEAASPHAACNSQQLVVNIDIVAEKAITASAVTAQMDAWQPSCNLRLQVNFYLFIGMLTCATAFLYNA